MHEVSSQKTVTAIIMVYKNTKAMVCLPDGDTDFFNVVSAVLQVNTSAPFLFIICLDYVLLMSIDLMKENGLTLKKSRSNLLLDFFRNYHRCRLYR